MTMHVDELETISDAFLAAADRLGLKISEYDSPEINLLRAIVLSAADHQRDADPILDSDHTMLIAQRATRLYRRFGTKVR